MTPDDLTAARKALGLTGAALGRALELEGRDPGQQVKRWESGKAAIPGPVRVAVRYMLAEQARADQQARSEAAGRATWDQLAADGIVPPADPAPRPAKTRRRG